MTGGPNLPLCVSLGGGGHARILIDALRGSGAATPYAVLERDRTRWGGDLLGVPIAGGDDLLAGLPGTGVSCFVVGVGGVGANSARRRLFALGRSHGLAPLTVRHPSAICSTWAEIGPGCALCPAAVVNAGAVVGANVIVNTGAIVEHDCVIGDHVHVATGARLAGAVRIGEGAHIGAGATVRQQIVIGEGAVVGAGAVVVDDVPAWTVVVGVPARALRSARAAGRPVR